MAERTRDLRPDRIVWRQSSRTHKRFYWLAVENPVANSRVVVSRKNQTILIEEAGGLGSLKIRLDDSMMDLDQPVVVRHGERVLYQGKPKRRADVIERTLAERGDPRGIWTAEITVDLAQVTED